MFTRRTDSSFIAILVYVDYVLLGSGSLELIQQVKTGLRDKCTMKDLGMAKYFLGLEYHHFSDGIMLNQKKYIDDIIKDVGLQDVKPMKIPFPRGLKLHNTSGLVLENPDVYRRIIERILYLSITRLDIIFFFSPTA